jgi:hypothetical protein
MKEIMMTDIHGKPVLVHEQEIYDAMARHEMKLFGMELKTIIALRAEFTKRHNGPMTPEIVKEVFA